MEAVLAIVTNFFTEFTALATVITGTAIFKYLFSEFL